ncbi:MAG: DEAD/DEAH box helicase [Candidatus Riflebacteria bacterium]|nr:DEAD/DEAH box helicase [Candidatus Riflebacteria bacterium]
MTTATILQPGTLVSARGREWVVLPGSNEELLMVRPIGGLDEEVTGIMPAVEPVKSATFSLPATDDTGDFHSCRMLREAARLSTRAAAGPFRCFGRIAVEPRPYQLVPLMLALKLDPVRLLIADDVGIGKTIEAALIARELLDRGEIKSLTVLCPPHLAEQWQRELAEKFHIDAELVLSSTIQRLERDLPVGVSVFDRHHFTIVSTEFIKTVRRADDFIIKCPEFVIVDEAHGCTLAGGVGRGRQQRFDLLRRIAADGKRHMILVTATPHSGNEEAFRSLLSLLNPEFSDLPNDLDKSEREGIRRKLARHLVQRRRADIRNYLETDTAFPTRLDKETTYTLSPEYRELFDDILEFAREYATEGTRGERRQRVRYWSALALLRCVSSSPAAAAATLRSRAAADQADDEEIDEVGRRTVLDQGEDDDSIMLDLSPGSVTETEAESTRRKLLDFARRAETLAIEKDAKFQGIVGEVKAIIKNGFQPVIFCRFVDTAEYVASNLRLALPAKVRVEAVTGLLPPAERQERIAALTSEPGQFVLVCTDCLSEGINLQEHFNAAIHYDLAWNPTRHEQREGRVDRFGQKKQEVRVITYYGSDNPIDGVILDVLIRKHKRIKSDLGVTVGVPGSSEQIAIALFEGALFRERTANGPKQLRFDLFDNIDIKKNAIHEEWENAANREKASRSRFAHHTISPDAVADELQAVRTAIGRSTEVEQFFYSVFQTAGVAIQGSENSVKAHLSNESPRALRQAIGFDEPFIGRFDLPLAENEIYLGRTSPVVEGLASWVLDQALDSASRDGQPVAARCGIISTSAVNSRTILLLARFRYHLHLSSTNTDTILCEEIIPLACNGPAETPQWLSEDESEQLLAARPERNLLPTAIEQQLSLLLPKLTVLQNALKAVADTRAAMQLQAHERVREASRIKGRVVIKPVLPVDILGAYVLLPKVS